MRLRRALIKSVLHYYPLRKSGNSCPPVLKPQADVIVWRVLDALEPYSLVEM